MDIQAIVTAFFANTYTQADARRRLNTLDVVGEQISYKPGQTRSFTELLTSEKISESDRAVLLQFVKNVKLPNSPQDVKKIFLAIKEEIMKRPVVTLTVAFEPSSEQIISYGKWFKENVNPKALMTIVFSASVIGGCSITWQGKEITYDLEYLLKAKRAEILAVVDKYAEIRKKERVI
jgi:F0F1-type ATP synthase delta subunit